MNKRSGFTLIELLIVVAIIAILAAIAVPNFLEAQTRSKISRMRSDIRSVATAVEAYYVDNNRYMVLDPGRLERPIPENLIRYGAPDDSYPAGNGGTPLIARMVILTTPIGYITSIPKDIFNPGTDPYSRDYPGVQGNDVVTWGLYTPEFESAYSYPGAVLQSYAEATGFPVSTARWVLFSYGPAKNPLGYDPVTDQFFQDNPGYLDQVYDPTNGTVSLGLVLRLGP